MLKIIFINILIFVFIMEIKNFKNVHFCKNLNFLVLIILKLLLLKKTRNNGTKVLF
jgi:hypothetical protein